MSREGIWSQSSPEARGFEDTSVWIFDLDNTLYPSSCKLFAAIDRRMGDYIARLLGVPFAHARHLQKTYYRQFGTTLAGLMRVHRVDPRGFLDYVHDIDLAPITEDPALAAAIGALPGRRLIFTNGSRQHAERVADKLGVLSLFEDICDIAACDYLPKPSPEAFDRMVRRHAVAPVRAAMFEDMPHNLEAPHALGMTTVLVHSCYLDHPVQVEMARWTQLPGTIDHATEDLTGFLRETALSTLTLIAWAATLPLAPFGRFWLCSPIKSDALNLIGSRGDQVQGQVAAMHQGDDRTLLQAAGHGDARALEQLFARTNVRVFRFLLRIVGNKALAEELLNEVFLGAWRNAKRYEGRSEPLTWLLAIAHNKAASALRKRREVTGMLDEVSANLADRDDSPEVAAQKGDKSRVIRDCIAGLSPAHRTILDLVYYQEQSVAEVAEILSIPENTVKTRMFYARKQLAVLLRAHGIDRGWP